MKDIALIKQKHSITNNEIILDENSEEKLNEILIIII